MKTYDEELFVETMKAYVGYVKQLSDDARNLSKFMQNNKDILCSAKCCVGVFATMMNMSDPTDTSMEMILCGIDISEQYEDEFKALIDRAFKSAEWDIV